MTKETLKYYIDNIIINHFNLSQTFFEDRENDGKTIIIQKDIIFDPLDMYEIICKIETKCDILVNDENIYNKDLTYDQFIDIFWEEVNKRNK